MSDWRNAQDVLRQQTRLVKPEDARETRRKERLWKSQLIFFVVIGFLCALFVPDSASSFFGTWFAVTTVLCFLFLN
jgi:hypothetical protein